jgi:hypothetical protein
MNLATYDDDKKKVALALSFMTGGTAAAWKTTRIDQINSTTLPTWPTWSAFKTEVKSAFDPVNEEGEAIAQLKSLVHDGPVDDYIAKFRILVAQSGITEEKPLLEYFYDGLKQRLVERIHDMQTTPTTLQEAYNAAAKLETLQRRVQNIAARNRRTTGATAQVERDDHQVKKEPNGGLGIRRLSVQERQRHMKEGLCFVCGKPGHLAREHQGQSQPTQFRQGPSRFPQNETFRRPIFKPRGGKETYRQIRAMMAELLTEDREEVVKSMEESGF